MVLCGVMTFIVLCDVLRSCIERCGEVLHNGAVWCGEVMYGAYVM